MDLQKILNTVQKYFNDNTITATSKVVKGGLNKKQSLKLFFIFDEKVVTLADIDIDFVCLEDLKITHPSIDIDNEVAEMIIYELNTSYNDKLLLAKLESIK